MQGKRATCGILVALAVIEASASEQSLQYEYRNGGTPVLVCESKQSLADLAAALSTARAKMDASSIAAVTRLRQERKCVEGPVDRPALHVLSVESVEAGGQQIDVAEVASKDSGPSFVKMGDLVALADSNQNVHKCTDPTSGEVDQWEAGKSGQLMLKRYWMTSKCEGGVMKSQMRPLN